MFFLIRDWVLEMVELCLLARETDACNSEVLSFIAVTEVLVRA